MSLYIVVFNVTKVQTTEWFGIFLCEHLHTDSQFHIPVFPLAPDGDTVNASVFMALFRIVKTIQEFTLLVQIMYCLECLKVF